MSLQPTRPLRWVLALAAIMGVSLVFYSACAPPNNAPSADAGDDQSVNAGDTVALDGSASSDSDRNALTYSWKQTLGTAVALSSTTDSIVTFTAPSTGSALAFELTVSDQQSSAAAQTRVFVRPVVESAQIVELSQPSILDDPAISGNFPDGWALSTTLEGELGEDGETGAPDWVGAIQYAPTTEAELAPGASKQVTLQIAGRAILMGGVTWIGTTDALTVTLALDGNDLATGEAYALGRDRGGTSIRTTTTAGGSAALTITNPTDETVRVRIHLGAFAL